MAGRTGLRLLERLRRQPDPAEPRIAEVAIETARALTEAGEYAEAAPVVRIVVDDSRAGDQIRAQAHHVLAKAYDGLGQLHDADPHWTAAEPARADLDSADGASLYLDRVRALRLRGRLDEAMGELASVPESGQPERHVEQAALYQLRGRPVNAKRAAERAVALYRERGMDQHPRCLEAIGLVADAEHDLAMRKPYPFVGNTRQILDELRKLHERYLQQYGPHSPLTLAAAVNYGIRTSGSAEGRAVLEAAERDACRYLGADHMHRLRAWYGLSLAAMQAGDFPRSLELAERAYLAQRRLLGEQHLDTKLSDLQRSVARYVVHGDSEATESLRTAYHALRDTLGVLNEDVWRAWVSVQFSHLPAPMLRGGFRVGKAVEGGLAAVRRQAGRLLRG